MNMPEKVKLSMCSIRTERIVKQTNYEVEEITISLSNRSSGISLFNNRNEDDSFYLAFTNEEIFTQVPKTDPLYIWHNYKTDDELKYLSKDPIQDSFNALKRLRSTYKTKSMDISFRLDEIKPESVTDLVSKALIDGDYTKVSAYGYEEYPNILCQLMNIVKPEAFLSICCPIPLNFKHDNAFKFHSMDYIQARWVTLDNLKSIRNANKVHLEHTNFHCKDVNELLHYWVNLEDDMMRYFYVKLKEGTVFDETVILDELVHLLDDNHGTRIHFIKAHNANRKFVIGKLYISAEKNSIKLQTYHPNEGFEDVQEDLDRMQMQKNLRMERTVIEREELRYQRELMEQNEENLIEIENIRREIRRIKERREAIEIELNGIEDQFMDLIDPEM